MSVLRKKYASESKKKYTLIKCRTLAGILNWIRLAFLGAAAEIHFCLSVDVHNC